MIDTGREIYDELVRLAEYRLPKINNKKRIISDVEKREISQRHAVTEENRYCHRCVNDEFEPRRVLLESDANGDRVCTVCGTVSDRTAGVAVDYADRMRVVPSARAHTRLNYMRERLSQWRMGEPQIPAADVFALRTAYNGGFGALDPSLGVYEFDPFLSKPVVRAVIKRAGLATRKYTEKWLTIRKLLGCESHPVPSASLLRFVEEHFIAVVNVWEAHRDDIAGSERKSMICYNFIFHMLLLLSSVDDYITHSPWFPMVSRSKWRALSEMWVIVCSYTGWPAYEPEIHADGTVRRRRITTMQTRRRSAFMRPRPVKRMRQTTINLTPTTMRQQ
jgi:hypothetical protein